MEPARVPTLARKPTIFKARTAYIFIRLFRCRRGAEFEQDDPLLRFLWLLVISTVLIVSAVAMFDTSILGFVGLFVLGGLSAFILLNAIGLLSLYFYMRAERGLIIPRILRPIIARCVRSIPKALLSTERDPDTLPAAPTAHAPPVAVRPPGEKQDTSEECPTCRGHAENCADCKAAMVEVDTELLRHVEGDSTTMQLQKQAARYFLKARFQKQKKRLDSRTYPKSAEPVLNWTSSSSGTATSEMIRGYESLPMDPVPVRSRKSTSSDASEIPFTSEGSGDQVFISGDHGPTAKLPEKIVEEGPPKPGPSGGSSSCPAPEEALDPTGDYEKFSDPAAGLSGMSEPIQDSEHADSDATFPASGGCASEDDSQVATCHLQLCPPGTEELLSGSDERLTRTCPAGEEEDAKREAGKERAEKKAQKIACRHEA